MTMWTNKHSLSSSYSSVTSVSSEEGYDAHGSKAGTTVNMVLLGQAAVGKSGTFRVTFCKVLPLIPR